jgi:uncharacterized membrane protein
MSPFIQKYVPLTPEIIFLILGIIFGCTFTFLTPPFQVPDEINHFFRAYQVSEKHILGEVQNGIPGGTLPASLSQFASQYNDIPFHPEKKASLQQLKESFNIPLEKQNRDFFDFRNTVLYSPIPYLPQALGIKLASMMNRSPIVLLYAGRLMNLSVWLCLMAMAISLTPSFKWVFLSIALTPMSLFLAGSVSADPVTSGLCFLFLALILKYRSEDILLYSKQLFALFLLSSLIALSKQVYLLLGFLVLLIPSDRFGGRKKYYSYFILLIFTSFSLNVAWTFLIKTKGLYLELEDAVNNTSQQWAFIRADPIRYLGIFFRTFYLHGHSTVEQFVGRLGWVDTILPGFLWKGYWILLLTTALIDKSPMIKIDYKSKILISILLFLIVFLMGLALYLQGASLKADSIPFQGRYFIPLGPLFFLLLYNHKIKISFDNCKVGGLLLSLLIFVMVAYSLFVTYKRYYLS